MKKAMAMVKMSMDMRSMCMCFVMPFSSAFRLR